MNGTSYSVTETSQNIAVIGAGINGLVAANYLQRTEHQVTLIERSDRVDVACSAGDTPSVHDQGLTGHE